MPSSTSPNMALFLPVPSSTPGPQWASESTSNWSTVDTHDHTAGKGVQIPIAALNVNADFSWLTFGQTNVGYLGLTDKLATGNLTVNSSMGNVSGLPYWRDGAGVVKRLVLAGDALTIASGTAVLGSLLLTAIAAPGAPSAGFGSLYFDSTSTNIAIKNSAGVVKHGVQTKAAVASNWLTSIADDGSVGATTPAFTDIAGSLTLSQLPTAAALSVIGRTANSTGPRTDIAATAATDAVLRESGSTIGFGTIATAGIANSAVTYAKIQNVSATSRILGRKTAGAGVTEELTPSDVALMTAGRVTIDSGTTLSATATYTSPSWTAGLYRKIILELECSGSAFTYVRFQANALSTSVYTDLGTNVNSAVTVDSAGKGTNGFARVGINAGAGTSTTMRLEFWPLTSGRTRNGMATSTSDGNSATLGNSFGRLTQFMFNDTATDVTFITITVTGATMTGIAKLYGELA